jgi:hypothetical protein
MNLLDREALNTVLRIPWPLKDPLRSLTRMFVKYCHFITRVQVRHAQSVSSWGAYRGYILITMTERSYYTASRLFVGDETATWLLPSMHITNRRLTFGTRKSGWFQFEDLSFVLRTTISQDWVDDDMNNEFDSSAGWKHQGWLRRRRIAYLYYIPTYHSTNYTDKFYI